MSDATERQRDNRRDYLYDMLSQLAQMARDCDEHNVALILQALIVDRGLHAEFTGERVGEKIVPAN